VVMSILRVSPGFGLERACRHRACGSCLYPALQRPRAADDARTRGSDKAERFCGSPVSASLSFLLRRGSGRAWPEAGYRAPVVHTSHQAEYRVLAGDRAAESAVWLPATTNGRRYFRCSFVSSPPPRHYPTWRRAFVTVIEKQVPRQKDGERSARDGAGCCKSRTATRWRYDSRLYWLNATCSWCIYTAPGCPIAGCARWCTILLRQVYLLVSVRKLGQ